MVKDSNGNFVPYKSKYIITETFWRVTGDLRADTTREYWKKHVYVGNFKQSGDNDIISNIHNTSDYNIYGAKDSYGEFPDYFEIPAHSVTPYSWYSSGEILFFTGNGRNTPIEVKETFSISYKVPFYVIRNWVLKMIKEGKGEDDIVNDIAWKTDMTEQEVDDLYNEQIRLQHKK